MPETNIEVAVYPNREATKIAIRELQKPGFDPTKQSIVGKEYRTDDTVVGYNTAIGAGLYGIGIPKDSIFKYGLALKANNFLVVARGTADEVVRTKDIFQMTQPSELALHSAEQLKKAKTV